MRLMSMADRVWWLKRQSTSRFVRHYSQIHNKTIYYVASFKKSVSRITLRYNYFRLRVSLNRLNGFLQNLLVQPRRSRSSMHALLVIQSRVRLAVRLRAAGVSTLERPRFRVDALHMDRHVMLLPERGTAQIAPVCRSLRIVHVYQFMALQTGHIVKRFATMLAHQPLHVVGVHSAPVLLQ